MRLEKRWYDFWVRCPMTPEPAIRHVRSRLWRRYRELHRAYHNLDHIAFCLAELDKARQVAVNPMVVETAIWFHDVIYDTKRKDNEKRSAILAGQEIVRLGGSDDFKKAVRKVIRTTTHMSNLRKLTKPTKPEEWLDAQLMCDVDLAGFGQDWLVVEANSRKIRQEYSWVPRDKYIEGRRKILTMFLNREPIYYTAYFRDTYEREAKENLRREIANLEELATINT